MIATKDYTGDGGIDRWVKECNFETQVEAMESLDTTERSWFRWKAQGLPQGLAGKLINEKMVEILKERQRVNARKRF